jgi:hypothetical protein
VTLALSAVGAVVGAALGALALLAVYIAVGAWRQNGEFAQPLAIAALFGAQLGFVLAPIAAWTLMRHVPLWRAIAETALGTVVGLGLGWLLVFSVAAHAAFAPILFALLGFVAAAIRLRLTHRAAGRETAADVLSR